MKERLPIDKYSRAAYEAGLNKLSEKEQNADVYKKEIEDIKRDLWRQLSNARTEAFRENAQRKGKELEQDVLPQILKIERTTQATMEERGDLSQRVQEFGRAVLEEAETIRHTIVSKKAESSRIDDSVKVLHALYQKFAEMAGNVLVQDRYGRAAT